MYPPRSGLREAAAQCARCLREACQEMFTCGRECAAWMLIKSTRRGQYRCPAASWVNMVPEAAGPCLDCCSYSVCFDIEHSAVPQKRPRLPRDSASREQAPESYIHSLAGNCRHWEGQRFKCITTGFWACGSDLLFILLTASCVLFYLNLSRFTIL